MRGSSQSVVVYHIDRDDVICWANDEWQRFAATNGVSFAVLGTSLWRHISSPTVEHLYRQLVATVRGEQRPVVFPFRCDSPTVRRFMRMKVGPLPDLGVEFASWPQAETPHSCSVGFGSGSSRSETGPLLRMCSWCRKMDVGGRWQEIARAVGELKLFDAEAAGVSHTICPCCRDQMRVHLHGKDG